MKFKIDENLPVELAEVLHTAHHDATTVLAQGLRGAGDSVVIDACRREDRVLVTLDLDFGDIHAYPPHQYPGFIVLRPHHQDRQHLIDLLGRVIPLLARERLRHHLWIVEETRVRIRTDAPA